MNGDMQRIGDALQFVPVGGHDERVRVAFMLKSELGDTGRDLWDEWRDGRGDDEAASVWKSASETGPLKIGTLFHEAKANGWRDDGGYQKPTPEELAERRRIAAERAAKEEAEIARERADTAEKAAQIWKAGTDPNENLYLSRKRVSPVATLREIDAGAAARSEWIATPAFSSGRPLPVSARCSARTLRALVAKRRWSSRRWGCVKPARSYSTGSIVRPMPISAAASASAHDSVSGSA